MKEKEKKRERDFLSSLKKGEKKKSFYRRKSIYIPAILLLIIFGVGTAAVATAFPRIQNVMSHVQEAKTHLETAQQQLIAQDFEKGKDSIEKAQTAVTLARDEFEQFSWMSYIPIARTQYIAAENVFYSVDHIILGVQSLITVGESVLIPLQSSNSSSIATISTDERITMLQALIDAEPELEIAQSEFDIALIYIQAIPEKGLLKEMRDAVAPLQESAPGLQKTVGQLVPLSKALPSFVGYPIPKTYLMLFQNNTELRPTGGFIGTYGIIKLENGEITSLESDNVYNLDEPAKENGFSVSPPTPLYQYNAVERWYLRDSNWSPDFPTSAQKAVEFYRLEGGPEKTIDGVLALDPTFIQSLLKITGPITVQGETFNEENFVERLQVHVSQGFMWKGLDTSERKDIIGDLGEVLMEKIFALPKTRWQELFIALEQSLGEKHLLLWMKDEAFQSVLANQSWDGHIPQDENKNDFYLVDANLASLKTDPAVSRTTAYALTEQSDGSFQVTITRTYKNTGKLNWKTTRYRTYVRMYVPQGSSLISSSGQMEDCKKENGSTETYDELGHTVFAAFVCIEPGKTRSISATYALPDLFSRDSFIDNTLSTHIYKQPGTIGDSLFIDATFNKPIKQITPTIDKEEQISDTQILISDILSRDTSYTFTF